MESAPRIPVVPSGAPRVLGRYAIYDAIASGGMATVHYGRLLGPVGFSRTVAIKRLHPQFAQDPQFVAMFLDEARLAARIRHPNVVSTLDVVASGSEIFLVMDYVHGASLSRIQREVLLRHETVPLPIALRIASDTLQGLHAAHEAHDERGTPLNIVHRDVSPQNILLGIDGIARLVDFGVAKASGQGATTREGHIKGKLAYMSPEQLRGHKLTRQSDVHGLAIVLWETLAGRRLFLGATEADTVAKVVAHEIPPASKYAKGLPHEVDAVLRRGLSDSLEERFASARDMCIALEACGPTASTMEVADWVEAQVHDLIERRSQVVSAIESSQHDRVAVSADTEKQTPLGPSAKEWVEKVAASDVSDLPTRAAESLPELPAADSVSRKIGPAVIAEGRTRRLGPVRWYTALGFVAGLVGVGLVVSSLSRGRTPVVAQLPEVRATVAAPSIPPPPPDPEALPPPPTSSVTAASPAPAVTPTESAPPAARTRTVPPRPPPAKKRPSDDVFNSRE